MAKPPQQPRLPHRHSEDPATTNSILIEKGNKSVTVRDESKTGYSRRCGSCVHWKSGFCELRNQAVAPYSPLAETCPDFEPVEGPAEAKPQENSNLQNPAKTGETTVKTGTILDKLPSAIDIPRAKPTEIPKPPETPGEEPLKTSVISKEQENITAKIPQPPPAPVEIIIKVEKEERVTDWELFKRSLDHVMQYEVLRKNYVDMRKGNFEDEFMLWFGSQVGAEDAEKRDKAWRKLKSNEKAHYILMHLLEKGIVHGFFIDDTELEDFFIQFGYNPRLLDLESWVNNIAETLYGRLMSEGIKRELLRKLKAISKPVKRERINPETTLLTSAGVFNMETRKLTSVASVEDLWFTEYSPLYTYEPVQLDVSQSEIDDIVGGSYDIESNLVYRLFAKRFPGENLNYVMDALGAIFAPERLKIVLMIIGESNVGKSTFFSVISKPIHPIASYARLEDILEYRFGPAELIGKQVLINQEESTTVLRKLRMFNTLFGAYDEQEVPQKFKRAARLMSLKLGIIASNDPPVIEEYQWGTLKAALNRLSIAWMVKDPNEENITLLLRQMNQRKLATEAFKLLLHCTVQLEKRGWQPRKMDQEAMLDLLKKASNPVYKFLEESPDVIEDPSGRVKGTELYEAYLRFCEKRGLKPIDRNTFYSYVATMYEDYERENTKWFRGLRIAEGEKALGKRQEGTALYEITRYEQ